ncbi:universal stress protein [Cellulosimicrobium funkei]|uniref:universal stress protein n=1 Tax=Cellulosimicrobium funkei TaxID=264251 RepID=UPI002041926B|nr:universal stress protein [Cellulosimicrobium funkei]MCM3535117.1 universal stress protein [Cellulosimicrobium funkei]
MSDAWTRGVVVGIDGSPEATHAFDWAVAAADRHHARLRAVHAQTVPIGPVVPLPAYDPDALDAEVDTILRRALGRALPRPAGAKDIESTVSIGPAAAVLVEFSRDADLVVVGRRGAGGGQSVLGSVSSATAARAHGPVAIVPTTARGLAPDRVVVGVDLDDDPTPALEIAFAEARACGRPVELVHAMEPATQVARAAGAGEEPEIHAELKALTAFWADRYPDVACHATARPGDPATVLRDQVTAFDLLVLGGRHHQRAVGRLLGSVPDAVLLDAPCAVVVAHTRKLTGTDQRLAGFPGR